MFLEKGATRHWRSEAAKTADKLWGLKEHRKAKLNTLGPTLVSCGCHNKLP